MHLKTVLYFIFSVCLMKRYCLAMVTTHFKCRGGLYPRSNVERFPVPDNQVAWTTHYKGYKPVNYTSPAIYGQPWADPDLNDPGFTPNWNDLDGKVNRQSYMGQYDVKDGVPVNPIGRTGIVGRGILGRWGPNHAADPVVTRWKRTETSDVILGKNNKPILQFVAIKRQDTGEWALPGGMVDPGEKVAAAAVREFQEEAINSFEMSEDEKQTWQLEFQHFFSHGDEVYRGYVDDRRNTDNSWMETIAYNFHDDKGNIVGKLKLHAGDDAVGVRWVDLTEDMNLNLYASHKDIVIEVLKKRLSTNSDVK